jgi:hypothetical protein
MEELLDNLIEFDCPGCGSPMQIGTELLGRKLRCSVCKTKFIMEEHDVFPPKEDEPAVEDEPVTPPVKKTRPTVQLKATPPSAAKKSAPKKTIKRPQPGEIKLKAAPKKKRFKGL